MTFVKKAKLSEGRTVTKREGFCISERCRVLDERDCTVISHSHLKYTDIHVRICPLVSLVFIDRQVLYGFEQLRAPKIERKRVTHWKWVLNFWLELYQEHHGTCLVVCWVLQTSVELFEAWGKIVGCVCCAKEWCRGWKRLCRGWIVCARDAGHYEGVVSVLRVGAGPRPPLHPSPCLSRHRRKYICLVTPLYFSVNSVNKEFFDSLNKLSFWTGISRCVSQRIYFYLIFQYVNFLLFRT